MSDNDAPHWLSWNTINENARHMERETRRMVGEEEWARISAVAAANAHRAVHRLNTHQPRVTLEQAAEIREARARDVPLKELAQKYGVDKRYISKVALGHKRVG